MGQLLDILVFMNIVMRSVLLNFTGALATTMAVRVFLDINGLLAWLVVVNLWVLALMMKDKAAAEQKKGRTPEASLLLMALAGGTPAIYLGRYWLRHKTIKESFNGALMGVVAVQVGFLVWKLFF